MSRGKSAFGTDGTLYDEERLFTDHSHGRRPPGGGRGYNTSNKQAVGVVADTSNGDGPPQNSGTRASLPKDDTHAPSGYRMSDVGFGFGVASSNSNTHTHARACCGRSTGAAREPLLYGGIYHSPCHLMELMSPPFPNRGTLAAGMEPSSPITNVRWTVKEIEHARYANSTLPPCSLP